MIHLGFNHKDRIRKTRNYLSLYLSSQSLSFVTVDFSLAVTNDILFQEVTEKVLQDPTLTCSRIQRKEKRLLVRLIPFLAVGKRVTARKGVST